MGVGGKDVYEDVELQLICTPKDVGLSIYSAMPPGNEPPCQVSSYGAPKNGQQTDRERLLLWTGYGSQSVKLRVNPRREQQQNDILVVEASNGSSVFVPVEVVP